MFAYSKFVHEWTKSRFACEAPDSKDFRVLVNGCEVPVYACRISAFPLNTVWPGHQRSENQTDIASYVNLVSNEAITVEVEPLTKTAYARILLKPYSKEIAVKREGARIVFTLHDNGAYVLELDDYHSLLYIFNGKPIAAPAREDVTHYFGAGIHFPGKLTLKSGDSVYVDRDALVYGCIFAEDAENIRIFGNGIFDDSGEERFNEHCYEPYTNGNVKFYDCRNLSIEGVGFVNSAIWCVNLFHCFDVTIDGVNVFGQWRYNTDGIDIVNSRRVTVKNSFVHSFDDTVVIKGIDRYSYESCTDILVEHCVLWCDWGKTLEIGLETAAREYKNIVLRDCDLLRAGNTACDIQNGDCAEVHDVLFEDIRIELEHFYTPQVYQRTQDMTYPETDETQLSWALYISNKRFRTSYAWLGLEEVYCGIPTDDGRYAGVHDITLRDIRLYADEKIMEKYGNRCACIRIHNMIPNAVYKDITVENLTLNGNKLSAQELYTETDGCAADVLSIR